MKKLTFILVFVLVVMAEVLPQGCLPEGIVFTTQEQIDNFQINYPSCVAIEGHVQIFGSDIENLNGLSVLSEIGGKLLVDSTQLTSFQGLNSLASIAYNLEITRNLSLDHLNGLDALTAIGGDIFVSFSGVKNFLGMPQIASIGGLRIYFTGTESFDGLQGIIAIDGDLSLENAYYLTSLAGLENVQSINGNLQIFQTELKSLSGLQNIEPNTIGNIYIAMNDSLSECHVESICSYLAEPGGSVIIDNNSPGCNTDEEILDACSTQTGDFPGIENSIIIYPNPTNDLLFFRPKYQKPVTEITVYDQMGQIVIHQKGIIDKIDISEFPNGIYFILFQANGISHKEKVSKI